MSLRVVTMAELRLEVLLEPERTGQSVAEVCRRRGISRETFYEYKRRYELEGAAGLEPRSRRPTRSPAQIDVELEVRICQLRKHHPRWGARRIRSELRRSGIDPPAVSTIHQVLRRNHLVTDQPRKRPKARKRFEREVPNDLWQIDATKVALADGTEVCERRIRSLGIVLINSGPYHPETLGKLERFHKTLKEWLADEGSPRDLPHLQELLDRFRAHYNDERPHQAIDDATPAERYRPSPLRAPVVEELEAPTYPRGAIIRTVWSNGVVTYDRRTIGLGKRWGGLKVRIVPAGKLIHVYYGKILVRSLAFDPQVRYQRQDQLEKEVVRRR